MVTHNTHCQSTLSVQWCPHARGPGHYPLTTKPAGPTSCPFNSPESPPTRPTRLPQPPACTTHTAKSQPMAPAPYSLQWGSPTAVQLPTKPATRFQRGPLHLLHPQLISERACYLTVTSSPNEACSLAPPLTCRPRPTTSPNLLPTSNEAHTTHSHSLTNTRDDCAQCRVGHLFLYLCFLLYLCIWMHKTNKMW